MRLLRALVVVLLFGTSTLSIAGATPAQAAAAHQLIQGSGSSWASNAILQWIADVRSSGLQVVFSPTGSAQGRIDFANRTSDFGVSDIGFLGKDPVTGANDTNNGRGYAYLPIVAGGTALPYHIVKNGQLVHNLRLSGLTLAKIFSGQITNWDDPAITKDNNGNAMPNLTIIPVYHSEGSGSTFQFTAYLNKQFGSVWNQPADEYFPQDFQKGNAVAENGSDGVMNFLTSGSANGAIGYDEYSYALGKNYPVAKVLNDGGYYTLPNQYNVAVALTQAIIDPSSLLQKLDDVYRYADKRTYPISSYSYAIIPIAANDATMNTAKRQTLADYLHYSVCQGQGEMGKIGYSPLPLNLVQGSFDRITLLHKADGKVDVSNQKPQSCNNPTFIAGHPDQNYLAKVAPEPPACDKQGAGPCVGVGNTGQANPGKGGTVATTGGGSGGSTTGGATTNGATTGGTGGGTTGTGATTSGGTGGALQGGGGTLGSGGGTVGSGGGTTIDPTTGQAVSTGTGTGAGGAQAAAATTEVASAQSSSTDVALGILVAALLLGLLIVPPVLAGRLRRSGS